MSVPVLESLEARRLLTGSDLLHPIEDIVVGDAFEFELPYLKGHDNWEGIVLSANSSDSSIVNSHKIGFGGGNAWRSLLINPEKTAVGSTQITLRVRNTVTGESDSTTFKFTVEDKSDGPLSDLAPFNAKATDSADWMLGSVHVNVVGFESDGSIDPNLSNWTNEAIASVKQSVESGLEWWSEMLEREDTHHTLTFDVDYSDLETPISTPYDTQWRGYDASFYYRDMIGGYLREEGVQLTNDGESAIDIVDSLRRHQHAQRIEHAANWAFTIFVNHGFGDKGGLTGGQYTGAFYEGNAVQLMGHANSASGADFSHVIAHEVGHVFGALDEYPGSGSYYDRNGVYETQNTNAFDRNPNPDEIVLSIMNNSPDAFDAHVASNPAKEMIGWRDSDGDGIFDVLDTPHVLTGTGSVTGDSFEFNGRANVTAYNQGLTINTVDVIEYRLNGGDWIVGNEYHSYDTAVAFTTSALTDGEYQIEFRTRDLDSPSYLEHGIASEIVIDRFTIGGANAPPVVAPVADQSIEQGQLLVIPVSVTDADGDDLNLRAVVSGEESLEALAYRIDLERNLRPRGTDYGAGFGSNRLFWSDYGLDYLTEEGELYEYNPSGEENLIATFNSSFYDEPWKLDNAQPPLPRDAAAAWFEGDELFIQPSDDFVGSFSLQISAADGRDETTASFQVQVTEPHVNRTPEIGRLRDIKLQAGTTTQFALAGFDPDGDELAFRVEWEGASIANASIEGETLAIVTSANLVEGGNVVVTVSDGDLEATEEFAVTVVRDLPPAENFIPLNANQAETTAWLIGSVHVTVVALESSDGKYFTWDQDDIKDAKERVAESFAWWEDLFDAQQSHHNLSFDIDFTNLDTPFIAAPVAGETTHTEMVSQFLSSKGHNGANFWANLNFSDQQRKEHDTNWAVTVYLSDREFGSAYQTNGAVIMDGVNQVSNWASILTHEFAHMFDAPDEYATGPNAVDLTRGVYNAPNSNARGGHPNPDAREDSIMDGSGGSFERNALSTASRIIIGWRDTDGDGIFDVLDQPLLIDGSGAPQHDTYTFNGTSSATTYEQNDARDHYVNDLTINTVDVIEYRLNGGDWVIGNEYHSYDTAVAFTTSALPDGEYQIEIRTRDLDSPADLEHGIASETIVDWFTIGGINNTVPLLDPIADQSVEQGQLLVIPVTATDADGDNLILQAVVSGGDSLQTLAYRIDQERNLRPRGDDYGAGFNSGKLFWSDFGVDYLTEEGELYEYDPVGEDQLIATFDRSFYDEPWKLADAQPPSAGHVAKAWFEGNELFLQPKNGFIGTFQVEVTASDGLLSASQKFAVDVGEQQNSPPVIDVPSTLMLDEGQSSTVELIAEGPDGNSVMWSASIESPDIGLPGFPSDFDGAQVSMIGNVLRIQTAVGFSGTFTILVEATDGIATSSAFIHVTVESASAATPVLPIDDVVVDSPRQTITVPLELRGDLRTSWKGLVLSAVSSNAEVLPSNGIRFGGGHAERSLLLTPVRDSRGTSEIRVMFHDTETGQSWDLTFQFTVSSVDGVTRFTWDGSDASSYELWINDAATNSVVGRYPGLTDVTHSVALPNGDYIYWIQDEQPDGDGVWRTAQRIRVTNAKADIEASPGVLQWDNMAEAETYEVWINSASDNILVHRSSGLNATSYNLPSLSDGEYFYWIQAENRGGDGAWGARKSFRVVGGKLATQAQSAGNLEWDAFPTAESYEIWINDGATNQRIIREDGLSSTEFRLPMLDDGNYFYWTQNERSDGSGDWSEKRSFTVVNGQKQDFREVGTLSWSADSEAVTYEIWINSEESGQIVHRQSGIAEATTSIPFLNDGRYHYWIQSETAGGQGTWSGRKEFTVENGTLAAGRSAGDIVWSLSGNAVTYEIWVSRPGEGNQPLIRDAGLTDLTYQLPAMDDGTYDYWIQSETAAGNGKWSSKMSFTIQGGTLQQPAREQKQLLDVVLSSLAVDGFE